MSKLWLTVLKIIGLVPTIAAQVHAVHNDLPSKLNAANAALISAISDAASLLPDEDAAIVQAVGATAQSTLNSTVSALHNNNVPTL